MGQFNPGQLGIRGISWAIVGLTSSNYTKLFNSSHICVHEKRVRNCELNGQFFLVLYYVAENKPERKLLNIGPIMIIT